MNVRSVFVNVGLAANTVLLGTGVDAVHDDYKEAQHIINEELPATDSSKEESRLLREVDSIQNRLILETGFTAVLAVGELALLRIFIDDQE